MSIFSSLNYLLTKAVSAINQTSSEPLHNILFKDPKIYKKIVLNADTETTESAAINTTNYNGYPHFTLDALKYNYEAEKNHLFDSSTTENDTSLIASVSKAYLQAKENYANESNIQFPNEVYPNAEHLLESWWNIFDERYFRHGYGLTLTLIMAYMIMLVVGVIGNVMVILVVLLRPQMRSVTNIFIMNLAVADLFVIVFCVPSTLLANIFAPWILGSFMCKAVAYVQGVSVCAAAYSLAAISLDRCQAVYRNYERPRGFSWTICVRTVLIIWIAAMSLTIPWAITFNVKVSDYDGLRYCVETWEVERLGNIYFLLVNFAGFYAIPLLLIFVSNWIIYCHVMHRHEPDDSAASAPLRKMHRDTRRHVLKMLGIVTITFLVSWLPVYVLVIVIKFSENISESEYNVLKILMPVAQWFGSWNSSINPVLYAFLNKKFRTMFKSILPSWFPVKVVDKYLGSRKTPSFTTAYTEKTLGKMGSHCKSEHYRHIQNGHSQYQANLLISTFNKYTGSKATNTIHTISSNISVSDSQAASTSIPDCIFNSDIGELDVTEIMAKFKNNRLSTN